MRHGTLFDSTTGIKGMRKFRMCQHGVVLVENYKPKNHCLLCFPERGRASFYVPDMTETFNHGLGMMTCGTRDAERKARRMGLEPVGDAPASEIMKQFKGHPMAERYR